MHAEELVTQKISYKIPLPHRCLLPNKKNNIKASFCGTKLSRTKYIKIFQ